MSYFYSLVVIDEGGNIIVDHRITPDQAVEILGEALAAKQAPTAPEAPVSAPSRKVGRPRKDANRAAKTTKEKKGKKRSACSKCGTPGHNAKTCPSVRDAAPIPRAETRRLTEDQFDELKHLQETGDLSSRQFAQERGLPLAEVNRAITARSYEEYSDPF